MPLETLHTLERAFALLDCFTLEQPELGVREAARLLNLSSSTVGRLMAALKELGVLNQDPSTHAYSLGGKVLSWAGVYSQTLDVGKRALPLIQNLQQSTGETVSLHVIEGNERVCVERIESSHNVRFVSRIGDHLPIYAGAAGKVLLAFLRKDRLEEILASTPLVPLTEKTIIDRRGLDDELAKIRSQGYSVSCGERTLEAAGVAAPIFDRTGEVIASLTISGPLQRYTPEKISQYAVDIVRVAGLISQQMGYFGSRRAGG